MSQFPAAGRGFQNTPRPAVRILLKSSYKDRKNRIILCYVLLDHYDVAKYRFSNTPCPGVPYFKYFESICAQYPIHRLLPCQTTKKLLNFCNRSIDE